mmetsp:Transcript_29515/g.21966  ORF Transcript_29515/g.21966 Transcript_29515/m.21966 type:complete len:144 (+) Transcript_29515:171-602(+)|eukprot:CAMPEP_0202965622 /NCGR_PEP_ID=MMETSP1396-20130829/9532_1 /ASSEMBLY_ACC=CAM_ASM_000872 /TAXON_ID= /ORGANISM="Pseudokeronopsis sp., Strain Brazil" /LENGTH=143 /DNA_ID=CAMNT_0049688389 /DNA_START=154 /DNA_END=585 /DNA_ORIENTATION=+
MYDFHERVLHALGQKSTIKLMVWGNDTEFKQLEIQNKICAALYDQEKTNVDIIKRENKVEIAETTQQSVEEVQDTLNKYNQLRDFHVWLKEREKNGLSIPETNDELLQIYRIERPKFLMPKNQKPKSKYSKVQRKFANMKKHS